MYFGLYNSLGTFQRMMNSTFLELLDEGVLANYIDDFVILAKTKKELEEQIIQFFKIVEKHNLCFNIEPWRSSSPQIQPEYLKEAGPIYRARDPYTTKVFTRAISI